MNWNGFGSGSREVFSRSLANSQIGVILIHAKGWPGNWRFNPEQMNMPKENSGKQRPGKIAFWLLIELFIYSAFIVAYFLVVLLFLRDWLKHIFDAHKAIYAIITLPLIIGQAALLHCVTLALRKLGGEKSK